MEFLLIVGNDKLGRKLISTLEDYNLKTIKVVLDKSSTLKRALKLLKKRTLGIGTICKMCWAQLTRQDYKIGQYPSIASNKSLLDYIRAYRPKQIILYRAGLIVNKKVIDTQIPLWNIHCLKLPEYGGLGQLHKALQKGDYRQCASCHVVTVEIDKGKVIAEEPYELSPHLSYRDNENKAYNAGIELIKRQVGI